MILIIDNNNTRGGNISSIVRDGNCAVTYYAFITGNEEKIGDWDELKSFFEDLIGENKVLLIHHNNSRSEDASKLFLQRDPDNRVVLYSGGGNVSTQIESTNCFAYKGKVNDDAKGEWDLAKFATAIKSGANHIFERLQGVDPEIEEFLRQICTVLPFAESWNIDLRKIRQKLVTTIEQKHGIQFT